MSAERPDPVVVPIIIKADVLGTAEALRDALMGLSSDIVALKVLHVGVGSITNNDVMLAASSPASASNAGTSTAEAVVVGFNVSPIASALAMMERERVLVIQHPIIYDILEDVSEVLRAAAPMREEEAVVGTGVILKTFEIKKKHGMENNITIAGSKEGLDWFKEALKQRYELKEGSRLGPGPEDEKEGRVLNRVVRWTPEGSVEGRDLLLLIENHMEEQQ